jgi:hypothetical protein
MSLTDNDFKESIAMSKIIIDRNDWCDIENKPCVSAIVHADTPNEARFIISAGSRDDVEATILKNGDVAIVSLNPRIPYAGIEVWRPDDTCRSGWKKISDGFIQGDEAYTLFEECDGSPDYKALMPYASDF